jgi:hypothetical protein
MFAQDRRDRVEQPVKLRPERRRRFDTDRRLDAPWANPYPRAPTTSPAGR